MYKPGSSTAAADVEVGIDVEVPQTPDPQHPIAPADRHLGPAIGVAAGVFGGALLWAVLFLLVLR